MPDTVSHGQQTRLLFVHALTALHPGSGTALGTVDLPVQRERHTQWPIIPGSSIKGVLRDACRENVLCASPGLYPGEADETDANGQIKRKGRTPRQQANEEDEELTAVFGPGKVVEDNAYAGALSVTDARILAFPVRSLCGVFAWVTCPAVLQRLGRDLRLTGGAFPGDVPQLSANAGLPQAWCQKASPLLVDESKIVLEEFEFERAGAAEQVTKWIAASATADAWTQERLQSHLVVIGDDEFGHFVRHATEVVARIRLDPDRKNVEKGALFYQEFVPAETFFYSLAFASPSRRPRGNGAAGRGGKGKIETADDVIRFVSQRAASDRPLQFGGDETVGKGLCTLRLWNRNGS